MSRRALLVLLLLSGTSVTGCFGASDQEKPGTGLPDPTQIRVYVNALLWTGNPALPSAEALVVQNGTILFVGFANDAQAQFPTGIPIDLGGRRAIPGMIDAHSHFVRVAAGWNCDAANNPFKPTFDNSQLADTEFQISRAQIATSHYQTNQSGKTPVDDRTTIANKDAAKRGLECAMKEAAAMGLTMSVEAGASSWDYLDVLQALEREGKVTMRHSLYITPPLLDEAIQRGIRTGHGSDLVLVAGIKFYSDGWLGPRTAALLAPYNDRPSSRGVLFLEQSEADQWVQKARDAGLKVATHTIGDQGVAVVLNAYTNAFGDGGNATDARPSFEHGSMIQQRFWDDITAVGAVVSYQHSFATSDQKFAETALGRERLAYLYSWKSLMDSGVVLAGGSDFPIEVLPPLWGLQRVVTRQELDGTPAGGWRPEEKLTVEEALRTITWNAAYNVFMEDKLGTLEVGKLADFVVLDRDILTIPPDQIAKTCVLQTYMGGRLVYDGTGAGSRCTDVRFNGVLPPRDQAVLDAIHERMEEEAWALTRLE